MGKKNNKMGKQPVVVTAAQTTDEFYDILAEPRASAPAILATTTTSTSTSSPVTTASSSSSPTEPRTISAAGATKELRVSEESIFAACRQGNVGQLRSWGRQRVRIRNAGAFWNIVFLDKLDVVRCLVKDLGADINQVMQDGATPLCIAAQSGNVDMVRCLMTELGADVNQAKRDGCTPLYIASEEGNLDVVRCLVDLSADVNKYMGDGDTPLFVAARKGNLDLVRFFVQELGADVNQCDKYGSPPIMVACFHGHADVVRWMVKAGTDPQNLSMAANMSYVAESPPEQTAYLVAKAYCSNSGCTGTGLKKCTGCLQARYCAEACQLADWSAHKVDCKRRRAELMAGEGKGGKSWRRYVLPSLGAAAD
jgi:hypothetical protein